MAGAPIPGSMKPVILPADARYEHPDGKRAPLWQPYTVAPFSGARFQENQKKAGDLSACAICGKGIKNRAAASSAEVNTQGRWFVNGDPDSESQGGFLVGPDCHRKYARRGK